MKIRTLLCLSILLALANVGVPSARADRDPGDRFLAAYFLVQEGDTAEASNDWVLAQAKFNAALTILSEIKTQTPEWHPSLLDFRTKYCAEHLAVLAPKVAAAEATKPPNQPATPVVAPPAPLSEADQVKQLQSELQKSKDDVRLLAETRDQLKSQLDAFLKEPAPTEREKSKEVLAQLHALQSANETANAQLAAAQAKAAHSDEIAGQLAQSLAQVKELQINRDQLNGQLQEALIKANQGKSNQQIEELMKKNADLTAELAGAQSDITKLRDQVLTVSTKAEAVEAAETVKLRANLSQLHTELDQTKTLLTQRTEELDLTRAQLEKLKTENGELTASHAELLAKLNESDRQLRAAKSAGEKNDQIIQQLHKENDLLRKMAEQSDAKAAQANKTEESGGFLWFKPKKKPAATPAPATVTTNTIATVQSEDSKLTATVKAPTLSVAAKAAADETTAAAEAASESPQSSAEVRLLLGQAHAAALAKDFVLAKGYLTTAAVKEPNNIVVLNNLANTLYQLNQFDEAVDILHKVITIEPNQTHTRSMLGVIYLRKGRVEDAYNELTRAVAIDPRNAEAHNYLGIVMSTKGWATAGEQEIRRAIELNPDYADAQFNLAVIYAREKTPRLELARYHYQKAVDLGSARDPQLESALKVTEAADPSKTAPKIGVP